MCVHHSYESFKGLQNITQSLLCIDNFIYRKVKIYGNENGMKYDDKYGF